MTSLSYACPDQHFVTQFQCRYRYCDDMRLRCQRTSLAKLVGQRRSGLDRPPRCPDGWIIVGMSCSGHHCARPALVCQQYVPNIEISEIVGGWTYVGFPEWTVSTTKSQSSTITEAENSGSSTNWSFSARASVSVRSKGPGWGRGASIQATVGGMFQRDVESVLGQTTTQTFSSTYPLRHESLCGPGSTHGAIWEWFYESIDDTSSSFLASGDASRFVCSPQNVGRPRCLPGDCLNPTGLFSNGVPPGCQCCQAGSSSAILQPECECVNGRPRNEALCRENSNYLSNS